MKYPVNEVSKKQANCLVGEGSSGWSVHNLCSASAALRTSM